MSTQNVYSCPFGQQKNGATFWQERGQTLERNYGSRPLRRRSRTPPLGAHRRATRPQKVATVRPTVKYPSNIQWWNTTDSSIPQCLEVKTLTSVDPQPEQKSIVIQNYVSITSSGVSGFYEVASSRDSIDHPGNLQFQCIIPSSISWIFHQRDTAFETSPLQMEHQNIASTNAQPHQQQNLPKKRSRKSSRQNSVPVRRSERLRLRNCRK